MIVWLTKEEVKRRALISPKEALEVSIEHHQQMFETAVPELCAALKARVVNMSSEYCGLCYRYAKTPEKCPLKGMLCNGFVCYGAWIAANTALSMVNIGKKPTWETWYEAERILLEKLKGLRDSKGEPYGQGPDYKDIESKAQ